MTALGMDARAEATRWERSLRERGNPERAAAQRAYLKSSMEFAGVAVPAMRSMVTAWCRARSALTHDELTALVNALWASPLYECRQSAVLLLERSTSVLTAGDAGFLEHLLRTSGTWALVDGLAATVAGDLTVRFPDFSATLDNWARDEDFWLRRSAMLALLNPLRRGAGDFDRFSRYADAMLEEKEFFVRKAIGWVLREVAKQHPELVVSWLSPRVHRVSGVTIREAVRPLPADLREQLLADYRQKRQVA